MRFSVRARLTALTVLAVVASAGAGVFALLVHLGVVLCGHHLGDTGMPGMAMPAAHLSGVTPSAALDACPILIFAALGAAMTALVALLALALHGLAAVAAVIVQLFAVLFSPGADAPWFGRPALVPVRSDVRSARRRPSRAPPSRV